MELVNIRELKNRARAEPGEYRVYVQVEAVTRKTTRGGSPFYEIRLADAEDHVVLKAWNDSPEFSQADKLARRSFVEVTAAWEDTGKYGIDGKNWQTRALEEAEVEELLRGGEALVKKQAEDFAYIEKTCGEVGDPRLRALCGLFLKNFGDRFRRAGAAREYHHARRGGLVEHVAQMMRSAVAVSSVYRELNEDLLVAGVLFHDVGKLWENCYDEKGFVMPYHEMGEMLGHISIGMELVNRMWHELLDGGEAADWAGMEPPNDQVRLHLLHMIASHHGQKDFGSPVVPATPEAMALHYIDNMDAKLEMFARGYETAAELGNAVYERVFPLPGKLVTPLGVFEGGGTTEDTEDTEKRSAASFAKASEAAEENAEDNQEFL